MLHGKRDVFLDDGEEGGKGLAAADAHAAKEQEAGDYAADLLVSRQQLRRFVLAYKPHYSKDKICAFAREQGVAPGIVVGQLQHEGHLPFSHCNDLKAAIDWSGIGVM